MGTIKKIISFILIVLFVWFSYILFSSSLNEDSYIHLLKDSFVNDVTNHNSEFIGFKSNFVSSERDLRSSYGYFPVVYYKLDYQRLECRGSGSDEKCSWKTYKTESDSTAFVTDANGIQISINNIDEIKFAAKDREIYDKKSSTRVIQYIIKNSEPIYIWGFLEDNKVTVYEDNKHNKRTLIVTDNARTTLFDSIVGVLFTQFFSAGIIILMTVFLYLINLNWKLRTYIAQNKLKGPREK